MELRKNNWNIKLEINVDEQITTEIKYNFASEEEREIALTYIRTMRDHFNASVKTIAYFLFQEELKLSQCGSDGTFYWINNLEIIIQTDQYFSMKFRYPRNISMEQAKAYLLQNSSDIDRILTSMINVDERKEAKIIGKLITGLFHQGHLVETLMKKFILLAPLNELDEAILDVIDQARKYLEIFDQETVERSYSVIERLIGNKKMNSEQFIKYIEILESSPSINNNIQSVILELLKDLTEKYGGFFDHEEICYIIRMTLM